MATATRYSIKSELGCRLYGNSNSDIGAMRSMLEDEEGRSRAEEVCETFFADLTDQQRECFYETAQAAREQSTLSSRRLAWTGNIRVLGGVHTEAAFDGRRLAQEFFLKPPVDPTEYDEFLELVFALCTPRPDRRSQVFTSRPVWDAG